MLKKILITVMSLVAISALAVVVTQIAVKPMSADLSLVGQGKPALVLAYENFSPNGGEALARLRQVRADYESQMHFIVADLGTPQGQAFARRYGLDDGKAVFLLADGTPLQTTYIAADENELRSRLDRKLAAAERQASAGSS
jgi:thioredoxin-like negative regulator of GroEL